MKKLLLINAILIAFAFTLVYILINVRESFVYTLMLMLLLCINMLIHIPVIEKTISKIKRHRYKKNKLLQAQKRYPIGSIILNKMSNTSQHITSNMFCEDPYFKSNTIYYINDEGILITVYDKGVWMPRIK